MYYHPHIKKNLIPNQFWISALIYEENSVLWHFTGGETFHEVSPWKDSTSTDANGIPLGQIFCLQNFVSAFFMQFFATEKVFLSLRTIYKSYKCYSVTFVAEICWLINLEREKLLFSSLLYPPLSAGWEAPSTRQLICCFRVEPFHFITLHLVAYSPGPFYMLVLVFFFWAIHLWLLSKLFPRPFKTRLLFCLFRDFNSCLNWSESLFIKRPWIWWHHECLWKLVSMDDAQWNRMTWITNRCEMHL